MGLSWAGTHPIENSSAIDRHTAAVRAGDRDWRLHVVAATEAREQMALAIRAMVELGLSRGDIGRRCGLETAEVAALDVLAHEVLLDPLLENAGS